MSAIRDITGRKKADKRFRGLLETMPDAMVIVNQQEDIVQVNSQTEKWFGYPREELLGQKIEMLVPARFRGKHPGPRQEPFAECQGQPVGAGRELCGRRKDGSEFPVEIRLSRLETEEGPLVSHAIRDITERKNLERLLQEKHAALEAANEELEAFSYSISHDLRAPVRAMSGLAGMLNKQYAADLPAEAREFMHRIQENAKRMGELVDGLLAFSGLSRQSLTKKTVAPGTVVRTVLDELRADLAGRRVQIEVAELPPCQADPTLLHRVFTNLMSNAVKYTRGKDPAVISVGFDPNNGEPAYFVRDNGAGFDMEYADKLFRVFQRLHRADQFEGTGVGLAIIQRIIQRHGGRVWARAQLDQGATFYFTLGKANHA